MTTATETPTTHNPDVRTVIAAIRDGSISLAGLTLVTAAIERRVGAAAPRNDGLRPGMVAPASSEALRRRKANQGPPQEATDDTKPTRFAGSEAPAATFVDTPKTPRERREADALFRQYGNQGGAFDVAARAAAEWPQLRNSGMRVAKDAYVKQQVERWEASQS